MGRTIRSDAAAGDVFGDVHRTLHNAAARGGAWQAAADAKLGAVAKLATSIDAQLEAARVALAPLVAAEAAADDAADHAIGTVADDAWNAIGRPAHDPVYAVIFPGGIAYYAEGAHQEQPDRMDLLAGLLRAGLHPRLDAATAEGFAKRIDAASAPLRAAVAASQAPKARVALLERMRAAAARAAAHELASLKRQYKADGASEAEIHAVIPDRPIHAAAPATAAAVKA